LFAALSFASLCLIPFDWAKIFARMKNIGEVIQRLAVFSMEDMDVTRTAFAESVCVAILSTVYSALLGLVIGVFMARNITPARLAPPVLSAVLAFIRAVPAFIWVLLVLVCLGFGPAPAIVGVCIHSTAFFSRAFAHSFEEVDEGALEALASTGAGRVKVFFSAVLPASMTSLIAWLTMNFETNFRASSILGMVGAGGVGYIISASMSSYKYGRAMTAITLVLVFSYAVEISFNTLKQKLSE
jgi:phosphonate transport system permease protein